MAVDSLRRLLLEDVRSAIETLVDGTGDYRNDIAGNGGAQFWAGGGISVKDVPTAVVYWISDQSLDEPQGYLTRFLEVVVDVFSKDQPGMSSAEVVEGLIADIERAVLTDPERSGIGTNTDTAHVTSAPFPSLEDSPAIGGSVRFRIRYSHIRAEPDNEGLVP